jgi:hypothetical protein
MLLEPQYTLILYCPSLCLELPCDQCMPLVPGYFEHFLLLQCPVLSWPNPIDVYLISQQAKLSFQLVFLPHNRQLMSQQICSSS